MSDFILKESSRCLHCKNPHCTGGCPVGYDVPKFMSFAQAGNLSAATDIVGHVLGEVCGYVCPREDFCKGHCVLKNNPIDVGGVEREVFAQTEYKIVPLDNLLAGKKIAVVGGGVSGVTFAEQCYRHGAEVVIFEKNQLLHTLRSIPDFRLPKRALDKIVYAVQNSKIKVFYQTITSQDLKNLQAEFDFAYLATGVTVPNKMNVLGEDFATTADDFLRNPTKGTTIVVGGGNTAMDCARLSARLGNPTVVAYRRTRQDMPAFQKEIALSEEEGVQFCFNLAPLSVSRQNGKLTVTFAKTVSCGRGSLTVTDETVTMQCDTLIVATGSKFDKSVYATEKFVVVDESNNVTDNLYAGGDATGKSLVAQAVSDALNAASAILAKCKE